MSVGSRVDITRRTWGQEDDACNIIHIDMDAFFAAVEVRERPELLGQPVIVGGQERAVVLSATYEAREFGVRAAMPMAKARRLCPEAVVVAPQMSRYRQVSQEVMQILHEFTPLVEQVSVDEAYLDVAGARRRWGSALAIGERIRTLVSEQLNITCSVGIGASKLIAKLASTHIKPDGIIVIPRGTQVDFVQALPIGALPGVGGKTSSMLRARGIETVCDLARTDPGVVRYWLGNVGSHLHNLAWARDASAVQPERVELSVGAERTLAADTQDPAELDRLLVELCEKVAHSLRKRGNSAATVVVKIKFADLRTVTRSHTLTSSSDRAVQFVATARALLTPIIQGGPSIRLLGVRAEQLSQTAAIGIQATLDEVVDDSAQRDDHVTSAIDHVMSRFGASSLRSASSLGASTTTRH